jgi:hypothetical protein
MAPALTVRRRAFAVPGAGSRALSRVVVAYSAADDYNPRSHECVTRMKIAGKLAALKRCSFGGELDRDAAYAGGVYYVPSRTIVGCDAAEALGIRGEDDLFGGVVPHAFVGTKTITHGLVDDAAQAPEGWSHAFAQAVRHAVLDGYSAFDHDDAMRAGERLLALGEVRVKPALELGGRGQTVVTTTAELRNAVHALDATTLAQCGVVLEQNLTDVSTFSVGQIKVDDLVASYVGTQSLAIDNAGLEVYGGSNLIVARGDFDALLELDLSDDMKRVAAQAQVYDSAAHAHFPGFFASRRNYDVVAGVDAAGERRTGVLEQSWRVGGASGAEIAALEWFRQDRNAKSVRAWCTEVYGESASPPPGATVYFRGVDVDDKVGFITKYTMVEAYADV